LKLRRPCCGSGWVADVLPCSPSSKPGLWWTRWPLDRFFTEYLGHTGAKNP